MEESTTIGDHVAGTTIRAGKVVGFGESDRGGRSAFADVMPDGTVTHGQFGRPPQNEEGTLEACQRLVNMLNGLGANYSMPEDKGRLHVDCECQDLSSGQSIFIQVVRACVNPALYAELCHRGERRRDADLIGEYAKELVEAISLKVGKIAPDIRPNITLALDAMEFPGLCFDEVRDAFAQASGAWAKAQGFAAIWIVGPNAQLIHRLA